MYTEQKRNKSSDCRLWKLVVDAVHRWVTVNGGAKMIMHVDSGLAGAVCDVWQGLLTFLPLPKGKK